jgi:hypothetical protein
VKGRAQRYMVLGDRLSNRLPGPLPLGVISDGKSSINRNAPQFIYQTLVDEKGLPLSGKLAEIARRIVGFSMFVPTKAAAQEYIQTLTHRDPEGTLYCIEGGHKISPMNIMEADERKMGTVRNMKDDGRTLIGSRPKATSINQLGQFKRNRLLLIDAIEDQKNKNAAWASQINTYKELSRREQEAADKENQLTRQVATAKTRADEAVAAAAAITKPSTAVGSTTIRPKRPRSTSTSSCMLPLLISFCLSPRLMR